MSLANPRSKGESGLALVATLLVIVMIAGIIAAAVSATMSVTGTVNADYRGARAFYAAEAGAEAILSDIQVALQDGSISDAELAAITPPPLPGFDFSGYKIEKLDTVFIETVTGGGYAGLYSLTQDLAITVPATDAAGYHAKLVLGVKAQAIPIFQFGVFFQEDLESSPSPPMNFYGRVHSNGNIYLSSDNSWYWAPITTPNEVVWGYKIDPTASFPNRHPGVFIANAAGDSVNLDFDSRDTPDPDQFKAKSNAYFDDRLQTGAYGLDSLKLPLPPGISPREIVRPKESDDSDVEKETKFAWLADTYVTVDIGNQQGKASICGGLPGSGNGPHPTITVTRPLGGTVPDDVTKCAIFDFAWERFFDSRDSLWVDALDLDISQLRSWINIDPSSNGASIIYVEFKNAAVVDPGQTSPSNDGYYFPILRLRNAAQLPGPLTVATEYPIYVWGDYNTINKQPAAIAGDSYSVLSNPADTCPGGSPGWCDGDHQVYRAGNSGSDGIPDRTYPKRTEVWTAILAGNFPTLCDMWVDPGCTGSWPDIFGGALENYPRLQENWKNVELMYRGSIVALWNPVYSKVVKADGTTVWFCCSTSYYRPPIRNWGFDLALLDPDSLPPGTPVVGNVLRTSFREGSY